MGSFRTILGLDRFFGSRSAKRAGQVGERLRRERKAVVQPALERLESRINLSFSNLNTIAQSMQLGEAVLPQVPGVDASVAQMLPTSLSDIVGLNAYGNGFSSSYGSGWSQFDTQFPTENLISGFGTNGTGWNIANGYSGGATASISNNVLSLTNGSTGQFNGIWNTTRIPNLDTTSWTASFTLTNSGASSQDGGSFMLQTAGTSATGNAWYGSGITNGVSFSWNNYNGDAAGTQFAVTTGGGTPVFTTNQTAVNMSNSSTPLNVVLQFDSVTSNLTATVTQGSASWLGTYNLGNISALHSGATVGFVGGNGGAASATTVTNFSMNMNQGALVVSDLQSVANTITAGLPNNITATVIPTNNGSTISAGNALTSSTLVPAYGSLPDLMLGQYTGGFTVQGWFNSGNVSDNNQRIIDLGNGSSSNNIIIGIANSQLFMDIFNGSSSSYAFYAGPTLSSNTWYHVTAVFGGGSSGNGALYLNSVLQGTTTSLPTINNIARSNNYWGKSNWSGDPAWQGQQDELRFWNRQLSATEIAANYTVQLAGNQNGLVAYYQANQGAYSNGTTLSDSSGNGHSATLQSASVTNTYGPATSTFPVGTTTDTAKAQVYLNALFNPYTSVNQPTSVNFYSSVEGNYITPLLFTYDGSGYTIVASTQYGLFTLQGNNSQALSWYANSEPFTFAANTNYWVGFSDREGLAGTYEYTGCIEWSGSSTNYQNQWLYTTDVPSNTGLDIGNTFANAGGNDYWLYTSTRNYSFNVVATASVIPSSTLGSTVLQSGVQIQWAEAASTYHAVFSTNGLDGGLHLSKSGISYIPITISAGVNLTLGLDSSSNLQAGVNSTWTASASYSNNLNLDIGLGYLDSRIQNGSYSLSTIVNANLFDTSTNPNINLTGTVNSTGLLTGTLGNTSDFSVASASQFPQISGNILVNASMPFTGQVGGQAFTSTPTLALPTQSAIANTIEYTQPLWILSNFGNYLALAQLDAAALVNSGLNNAGGSLASIGQTDWQQVPFSTSSVNYNWGNGLNNAAGLLYQNKLSIAGRSRILGNLPHNNYGATFNITRGTGSSATASTVNLAGNLASSASSIETGSLLIAAPIAYYLSNQLAGSGLGCREQPNHPGYLEFYATDPTITAFQMSPYNPNSGTYAIGSTAANAFSALGFFAQTATSTSLLNGSFEGPYVVPGTSMKNPANAQWTFTGSSGLASNGSTLYTPNALNGTQAGYAQGASSLSQTLLQVEAGAYQLSFLAVQGSGSGVSANPATVTITPVGGGSSTTILNLSASQLNATGWNQFTSSPFTLPAGNYTLQFSFTGGSGATTCIDNIQLNTYTLNAQQATYPAALSFQGLLDAINQPNLIPSSAVGSPTSPPVAYPNSDSSTGTLAFNTAITYTSANIPTAVQFVANVVSQNQYLTPVLLSVSSGTYTLRALASPIQVTRTGLQTANLIFNNFTPASGTTYVLGYIDGNITSSSSTGAATINSQCQGTVGADFLSGTGTWWASNPSALNLGSTVVSSGSLAGSNRFYSFGAYSGLAQAGQGSVARPDTDTSSNNSYVYTAASYTTALVPTKIRYYTNLTAASSLLSITPMLFTSQGGGKYTVAAVGNSVTPSSNGLNEAELVFPTLGSLTTGTSYLFGYQNTTNGVVAVLNGASPTGGWVYTSSTGLAQGSSATFSSAGIYSLDIIASQSAGNAPTGSSSGTSATGSYGQVVINPNTAYYTSGTTYGPSTSSTVGNGVAGDSGQVFINTNYSYTAGNTPGAISYNALSGSTSTSTYITPLLYTLASGQYTLVASSAPFLLSPGQNSASLSWVNGSGAFNLAAGTTYYFGYRDSNGLTDSKGNTGPIGFADPGTSSNSWLFSSNNTGALSYNGSVSSSSLISSLALSINVTTNLNYLPPILPTAMQVYATVPSSGSGWITPLLFQQNGSGSTATFKLVAAGVSQEVTNSGASQLLVEFPTAVIAGLPYPSTYVMGYSTQQVQLGSGGSINAVNSRSPGMVQYPAGSASLAWLTSAGAGSSSATSGYPSLTVGSSVFSQGSTQSTSVLTSGNAYACTFLTDATQYQPYSWLGSVQYNASATGSNGKQVLFSYADISNGSAAVNISASGINKVSVPNVSNLNLTGSANVQAAVSATRQFSLLLDANIMTNGASASNQQQQATAAPLVTNVLTSINTTPGTMPYGVDGFLSSIIQVKPSSQVYSTAPVVSITDSLGYSLNSSTAYPAYGNLPDLQLGQYTQKASQAIIGTPIINNGGSGYTSAPAVTITDSTGTGATATATINNGVVTGITITNGGSGYSAPVISFSGGGGTGASAQFSAANLSPAAGFTVQAWFNSSNVSDNNQRIIDLGNGSSSDNIIIYLANSQLGIATYNGSNSSNDLMAGPTLSSNTWYHVTAVFGGGSSGYGALYLNGVLQGTTTSLPTINNIARSNNYWGKSNWSGNPAWQGQQDELRFWNTPLTQAQIQANWNAAYSGSQPNLIACYKTDKTYGTTSDDSSGFGNRASLSSVVSAMTIANGSATISSASVPTAYTPAQVTTTAPGVYYLTGTAAATSGYQPVSLVVLVDGVPLTTISSSLQSGSGYKFTSNGLQLPAGSHTVSFVPQGATAGGSSLSGLALNFSPLVRSSAPLPLTGKGATAVAVLDPNTGLLSSISMTNPGSGYANPVVIVQGDTGASAVATVGSNAGPIQSLKVVLGGKYYTSAPFVTISDSNGGTGTGASATAIITNGVVTGFTINNSGSGYKKPVVTISAPTVAMATRETIIPVPNVAISDASGQGAYANAVLNQNGILASILVGTNTANATANLSSGTISSLSLTNPGQFYTSAPAVTITDGNGGTGSGASATATVTTGMIIAPPAITNAGSGYSVSPSVKISDSNGGTGTGAVAFANMYNDGTLKSIVIANPGSGYTNPVFTLSAPGGSGTTATVSYSGISNCLGGVVTGLTVTGGGSGYTAPVVTIAPPTTVNAGYVSPTVTLPYNSDYAATATAAMGTNGTVSGISISSGGSGYSTAPAVTIGAPGSGGVQAVAVATVINGVVTGITVTSAGSGYTSTPSISIASPNLQASATAVAGRITSITVPAGAGGSGYLTAPAVSIIDPNGKNAVAIATITNGVVTGISVTNPGSGYVNPTINIAPPSAPATAGIIGKIGGFSVLAGGTGYTSAPTVTIMDSNGGTGSGATATATISGGKVTGVTVSNAGSGYSNPVVTFAGGGGMGASATAWLAFSSTTSNTVAISNGGYGYTITPTVQVLDSNGGTGTNVTATATMNSSGVVTAITLAGSSSAFSSYKAPVLVISPPSGINATAGIIGKIGGFSVLSGGSGYNSAPAVAITDSNGGTGSGATATATFSGGKVTGITVTNAGSGYKNPVVSLTGGGGTGASSTAWLAFSSTTSNSVAISNGGAGYTTAPTVQVLDSNSGTGTGVTGTATINSSGVVTAITLAGSFSSYTAPVLVIAAPPTSNPATATATVDSTVSGLTVTAGGSGYTAAPTVTIVDGNGGTGSGATATATVVNNVVTGITITNPGSGYSNPVITLSAPTGTTAQAAAMNWSVQLTSGGQFYSQPPVVTVSPGLVMDNVKVTNGPATSTFPVGTSTDPNYDQVAINANYVYTTANQPVSVSFYSAYSGHYITPLLFTLNNGVYTLVASTQFGVSVSSGNNLAALNWYGSSGAFSFAPNTNYYVGFKDGNEISDYTGYSGCIEWSNTSSNPNNQWLYTSQTSTNASGVPGLGSLGIGNTFSTASGSIFSLSGGTRNYSFNVTSSSYVPGPGSGATATATLQNGVVTGITINNPGSGYTVPPIITIANPVTATAVLSQGVMEAEVTYAGTLYQTPPTVTITDSSGNGTGATGYAVLVGGQVSDIVITNYGSGYVSPVVTLSAPTVDISQVPNGPSAVTHTFYFLDGSSWSTTTTSDSGISIQYQLIDQLNQLANAAANGLTGGNGSTAANYYNLQAYLTPLLSSTAPTYAQTGNLGIIFPSTPNPNSTNTALSPLMWNMSAGGGDPLVTQALFSSGQWNMATVGAVGLGNIDLVMNLAGNSGSPGFTGTAQVGYLDVNLTALDFSPDIDFTLDSTPGTFFNFGTWQGILSNNSGLAQYAVTTSSINSYDLTLSAQVSSNVASLLSLTTSGNDMPEVTFTASGGNGVYTGSFSDANWGAAEGMLYISQANIGTAFEQIAMALAYTDTSSYLAGTLPFVNGTLQDLTGFSDYFVNYLQDELVSGVPTDLDSLIDWVNDNSSTFTLAFGSVSVGSLSGQGLYLSPTSAGSWSDSVSTTTQIALSVPTYAALAGGLPASQNMLAYMVVPPSNTGDVTVTADVAWQAPMGVLFTSSGSGTSLGYSTQGYIAGSSSTTAWNLSAISVQGENLDFQGTLGTLAIYFESDTYDTAKVNVSGGQIATTLSANTLASSVVTSTLVGSVGGGGYNANMPVYYPTSTCYSGNFNISGSSGGSSTASLVTFLNQAALFNATLSGGIITGFTAITAGSNYLTASAGGSPPQVLITDAAGQGTGATATATVNSNGTISLTLTSAGSGYVSPVVTLVGGTFNFNNPTGTPSVTFTLPDIDNNDIAALSMANALGDPNIFQQGMGALQGALQSSFNQSMANTSQIIIGTGTSEFSQAFGLYSTISDYLDQALTPFVPTCDQNATASATTNSAGEITAITMITTGESYQSTPTVTITDNAGIGSGATATANMVSDGNGGLKVGSITITNAGSGYQQPLVSIGSPSAGNQSADEQLYNEACTVYNLILQTPGLVLDASQPQNPGSYNPNGGTTVVTGQIPLFFDVDGNPLTYDSTINYFIYSSGQMANIQAVQLPLIVDFTLQNTSIPFSLGMPGIPLTINNPADLNLVESGSTTVNLTFGIDALNGFYIVPVNPSSGTQFSGTVAAGPDSDFSTTLTLGLLSGTMSAATGEIFTMPFSTTMNDPNYNVANLNNQLTLAEINSMNPSSLFQTTLSIPTVGLNIDLQLKVAGGGIAAALPSIGNTMSITWTPGQGAPQLSYDNFYIDLGSFLSDYMGSIAPQLTPITNGVQPILNALGTQTPVLGDIIGGDTSLLGLANRFGGANLGFVQALDAIVDMLGDVTSAVNYMNANPGASFIVPLDVVATFANDFRTASSGLSKPQQLNQLPSQSQVVASMNSFMSQYANTAAANFTEPASRVVNQDYGMSGGLGISFDILDPTNIIGLITGQTVDIFHIDFPSLAANFSIDYSFPLDPPLYMTFGGGVSAAINLSLGMDSSGLEQWVAATVDGTQALSAAALEGLAQDIIMQGFFVDGANTSISTSGYLSLGVQLNAGIAKAGVEGDFNIGMTMTPNVDSSGRLNLQEMIQLAGADFSSPLNLFDFDLKGTISADAYLQLYLPFSWMNVWSHSFGSFTLFNIENNPAPPTEQAASYGSLYLNMGPTAGRRSQTKGMTDEHFEIRHLGGVAGDETLSVQLYDPQGNPQYVDSNGNPKPQVYYNVDKVVGIGGKGHDIIDCTGVLSPTHLEGGDGRDTLIGGLGLNYLDGGNGPDRITGGPLADTIKGGDGDDTIQGGGGADSIDGGKGDDSMDSPQGGLLIPFGDRFGSDRITAAMLAGSTLDFSQVTQNLKVTLGTVNTIEIGKNYSISWTGAGPAKIILGKGEDNIVFTKGYSSVVIDSGAGRDRFEIFDFETGQTVTIDAAGNQPDNTFLVKTGSTGEVVADQTGVHSGSARFNIDWTDVRKLTLHETGAKIDLDFANSGVTKILAFGNEVDLTSGLKAQDVRLEAASLVSVQADIIAAKGGEIALVAGANGMVKIGTSGDAKLSTLNGNIDVEAPVAYLGGKGSVVTTTHTNGNFIVEADQTIRTAMAPTPFFNTAEPAITVGQGGTLRAWSTGGTPLTPEMVPFQGYQGVPRFNTDSDLDGDGIADLVSVPQPGVAPHMVVFSGKDMSVLRSVYVFDQRFLGGVNVTTGDVDANGVADIILAADAGATPHVVVISGGTWEVMASFYAFDKSFKGGLRLATADADGDGVLDIITSTASGPISHVVAFGNLGQSVISSFYAFPEAVKNGVEIAAADLNNDNIAELILGTSGGTSQQVGVYRGNPSAIDYFMAYENWNGDVRVGSVKTAGKTIITTGPGPGAAPNVRTFDPDSYDLLDSFFAGNEYDLSGVTL